MTSRTHLHATTRAHASQEQHMTCARARQYATSGSRRQAKVDAHGRRVKAGKRESSERGRKEGGTFHHFGGNLLAFDVYLIAPCLPIIEFHRLVCHQLLLRLLPSSPRPTCQWSVSRACKTKHASTYVCMHVFMWAGIRYACMCLSMSLACISWV